MIDTDGDYAEWIFPARPGCVRSARHAVHDALRYWGLGGELGDLTVLLVSELVTNSLRHASGPIGVRLVLPRSDGRSLRFEVATTRPSRPSRPTVPSGFPPDAWTS